MNRLDFEAVEELIGYVFSDRKLLEQALTHSSYANEKLINNVGDYERLEFLGDAVLELTVSRFLYENYPKKREGEMTRTRAALVCEPTLSGCAREMGLPEFILFGKGEEASGGRNRDSILCDVFEAVAGAIYADGGYESAEKYIHRFLLNGWENRVLFTDSKTILQETIQKRGGTVAYENVSAQGPSNSRVYVEELIIDGKPVGRAEGPSRKSAQQRAAYDYLCRIKE